MNISRKFNIGLSNPVFLPPSIHLVHLLFVFFFHRLCFFPLFSNKFDPTRTTAMFESNYLAYLILLYFPRAYEYSSGSAGNELQCYCGRKLIDYVQDNLISKSDLFVLKIRSIYRALYFPPFSSEGCIRGCDSNP